MSDKDVYAEIRAERARQDKQWGGPDHDDTHGVCDWMEYRRKFEARLTDAYMQRGRPFDPAFFHSETRKSLVILAALCVAQIESLDRLVARPGAYKNLR